MEWNETTWSSRNATIYRCLISRVYHLKRARFLALCGLRGKARLHTDLAKAFVELHSRIVAANVFDEQQAAAFEAEVLRIEVDEPRTLGALVRLSQNEVNMSRGQPIVPVTFVQRLFAQLYDFDLKPVPMEQPNPKRQGGRGSFAPATRTNMNIDTAILDELVREGMGENYLDVIDAALRLSRLLARYKDKNGDVYVLAKQDGTYPAGSMIAVHAFECSSQPPADPLEGWAITAFPGTKASKESGGEP
ncbi:hypothetical protein SAMN05216466_106129 [Paraburkholderia phenazinium]|uniref:Uncharacterized protein n=1 Tax=Paraburkholderia phenazinium TaxID=60549 RepID=A0A1G7YCL6_9BURK|nr:hypothetical protein [Paraburkholderia phenazinium]SDG94134.1 hypothetical protein SAMN05216466_106129 [Paraburkholderia phenazinium]